MRVTEKGQVTIPKDIRDRLVDARRERGRNRTLENRHPLHVAARKGSILNCRHPAAVNGRIAPAQRVVDLIHGALARIVPERVTAAGNGAVASA